MTIDKDFKSCLKSTSSSVSEAVWLLPGKYSANHKWVSGLANGQYANNIKLMEARLKRLGLRLQIVVENDATISPPS